MSVMLRAREGSARPLAVEHWSSPATGAEIELLAGLSGPVLDLGCGPARLVVALAERGTPALGVDASPSAATHGTNRGATVLCRSLFDPLPGEGRWHSILLFDGNIGIGGDPVRLLERVGSLMAPDGIALVEADPPGSTTNLTEARVDAHGVLGPWFPWAWVAADRLDEFAASAGLALSGWLRPDGRWVARLRHSPLPSTGRRGRSDETADTRRPV